MGSLYGYGRLGHGARFWKIRLRCSTKRESVRIGGRNSLDGAVGALRVRGVGN